MARREIFAGNWKMHKTFPEAEKLVRSLISALENTGNKEIIIFPPFPYVRELVKICENSPIKVGMQNMYYESEGAFTGEISPPMVKDSGCDYILIGHSERRHKFRETDDDVNNKVIAAFENDLEPVVCVGELLEERESGSTNKIVQTQIESAFKGVTSTQMEKTIIAYEPVWAIGTGKVATPEIAEEVHGFIRDLLSKLYNNEISDELPILYGGSVKPDNISSLYSMKNIDGVLVGGASLKADSFLDIINVS